MRDVDVPPRRAGSSISRASSRRCATPRPSGSCRASSSSQDGQPLAARHAGGRAPVAAVGPRLRELRQSRARQIAGPPLDPRHAGDVGAGRARRAHRVPARTARRPVRHARRRQAARPARHDGAAAGDARRRRPRLRVARRPGPRGAGSPLASGGRCPSCASGIGHVFSGAGPPAVPAVHRHSAAAPADARPRRHVVHASRTPSRSIASAYGLAPRRLLVPAAGRDADRGVDRLDGAREHLRSAAAAASRPDAGRCIAGGP